MTTLLEQARAGLAEVAVPPDVRAAALEHLDRWVTDPRYAPYRDQIASLVARGRFDEVADAFRQVLPFGTGGRRGRVGVGPNRMNPFTVSTSVQGHVHWLRKRFDEAGLAVVIAYDVRRFEDVNGVLDPELPSPLRGLSSRDLAELAARIYAANGVAVHLLPRASGSWVSTPELSFAIRHLGAQGGLNLSASHNPPDDNGVKVYDHRGGQLVPPDDEQLLDEVAAVDEVVVATWDDAMASGRLIDLDPEVRRGYLDAVAAVVPAGERSLPVLYTPLHGTGIVHLALRQAGFDARLHGPQAAPDGLFSTVPGQVANPERPEAMAHAIEHAGDAVLVFGTDPDADRIGCEVLHDGGWVHLSGNDIGVLVVRGQLQRTDLRARSLVVQTEVTSSLVARVARAGGAAVVDDLLVGFKYVADVLRALEEEGTYGGLEASDLVFVAGVEESHGVLVSPAMRDKDAAGAAVVLAALADGLRAEGRTLVDELHALQHAHGYVVDTQVALRFEGASGQQRLADLLATFRADPPATLAGRPIGSLVDHRDETGRFGPFRSGSDRDSRNVLVLSLGGGALDDGARVILRPSGTEPKLKVYVEIDGHRHLDASGRAAVDRALGELADAIRSELRS